MSDLLTFGFWAVCAEFKDPQSIMKPITIGVISPYSGQVCFIRDQLCKSDSIYDLAAGASVLDVEVRSIDGFQGKETDIIIFSGRIGFVDDERRMNVALTRGR
jgi:superfamily I DNA and/or RNA helicase